MPNYKNAKIYTIRCPDTDDEYIGSTIQTLAMRMGSHRRNHKKYPNACASGVLIGRGNAYIELIEEFPCDNVEQLRKREGEIIRSRPNCLNRYVAGRSDKEYREEKKEHRDTLKKEYYQANREKVLENAKSYHQKNKEARNAYAKEWRVKNKEAIAQKRREKYWKTKGVLPA